MAALTSEGAGSSPHNNGEVLARKGAGAGDVQLPARAVRIFLASGVDQGVGPQRVRQPGAHGFSRHAAMGAGPTSARSAATRTTSRFSASPPAPAWLPRLVGSPVAKGLFHRAISESGQWMGLGMAPMVPLVRAEKSAALARRIRSAGKRPRAPEADFRLWLNCAAGPPKTSTKTLRGSGMVIDGWIMPEDLSISLSKAGRTPWMSSSALIRTSIGHGRAGWRSATRSCGPCVCLRSGRRRSGNAPIGTSSRMSRRSSQASAI